MELASLSSGSSGNCFYVGNPQTNQGILIDVGISAKQTLMRLAMLNKDLETIKGIFITHEHSDHIKGADVLARKFNIPIFATKKTINSHFICSNPDLLIPIRNNQEMNLAGLDIEAFPKSHSAIDPIAFNIYNGKKASVITDLGYVCKNTEENLTDADFLFLESNHDENMLINGPYPWHLKNWIKGNDGHLSNRQASLSILEFANKNLKHIVLSHLSENNNTSQLALKTFHSLLKERKDLHPNVSISPRHEPTQLFRI